MRFELKSRSFWQTNYFTNISPKSTTSRFPDFKRILSVLGNFQRSRNREFYVLTNFSAEFFKHFEEISHIFWLSPVFFKIRRNHLTTYEPIVERLFLRYSFGGAHFVRCLQWKQTIQSVYAAATLILHNDGWTSLVSSKCVDQISDCSQNHFSDLLSSVFNLLVSRSPLLHCT